MSVYRALFGLLMFVAVVRFFSHGWIAEHYLEPRYFIPYYGFEWVRPWPGQGMYLHFAALGATALLVAFGAFYRASVVVFGVLFTYAHLIDKTHYLNHYYLVSCLCLLLSLLPLERGWSFDAWRKPELRVTALPAWVLWALRAQVGLVYFFGGLAKLKADWLLEAEPLKIWLAANSDFPLVGRFFVEPWVAHGASYAGAAFDLSIVPLLLWRRSRTFAFAGLLTFHLLTAALFQIGMFPWIMLVNATLFLPPDWPRQLAARLPFGQHRPPPALTDKEASASTFGVAAVTAFTRQARVRRAALCGVLAIHFSLQLLLPLRHWLYPGNVCWTEQGFAYAWNVMLMQKDGSSDFRVTEPSSGRQWQVAPTTYLTRYQAKMMASEPSMILAFAHIVAADFRTRGVRDPEVRVDAFATLNGRPMQRLIDPTVDLAREHDGFLPKRWILPLREGYEERALTASDQGRR